MATSAGKRRRSQHDVRGGSRRLRGADSGAALVEYALVVAMVAAVAAGGLQTLGDRAVGDLQRHASCVAERPVPSACRNPVDHNVVNDHVAGS